jgi:multiple sugar transport system permease protein
LTRQESSVSQDGFNSAEDEDARRAHLRAMAKNRRSKSKRYWLFLSPSLVAVAALIAVPLGFTFYYSLKNFNLQTGTDSFNGVGNYVSIFTGGDRAFLISILRTFLYVFVVIAGDFLFAMTQALLIFSMKPHWAKVWRSVFMLPILIIPTASAVFWKTVMWAPESAGFLTTLGLKNIIKPPLGSPNLALWAIVITVIWAWSPWVFLLFSTGLDGLDKSIIDASMVDGATYFQRLRYVIMPILRPVIFVTLAFKALDSFLSFPFIWLMTQGGPGGSTHLVSTYIYQKAFEFLNYGAGSALAIVILLLSGGLSLFAVLIWQRNYGKEL